MLVDVCSPGGGVPKYGCGQVTAPKFLATETNTQVSPPLYSSSTFMYGPCLGLVANGSTPFRQVLPQPLAIAAAHDSRGHTSMECWNTLDSPFRMQSRVFCSVVKFRNGPRQRELARLPPDRGDFGVFSNSGRAPPRRSLQRPRGPILGRPDGASFGIRLAAPPLSQSIQPIPGMPSWRG